MTTARSTLTVHVGALRPGPRRLAVSWRDPVEHTTSAVGMLSDAGDGYKFAYLRSTALLADFRPFIGFPVLDRVYRARQLFPFFSQRVMSSNRPDFADYLSMLALSPAATAFDVLARSGGKRKGDSVQVVEEPWVDALGQSECSFFVAGVRHSPSGPDLTNSELSRLAPGGSLRLVPETDNPVNPRARLVMPPGLGTAVGWVPDLLLGHIEAMERQGVVTTTVIAVNGPDRPWHLRLLVQTHGRVALEDLPFRGTIWKTFEADDQDAVQHRSWA